MRFGYTFLQQQLQSVPKRVVVAAGLLVLPFAMRLQKIASAEPVPPKPALHSPRIDPRTQRLVKYMAHLQCPVLSFAEDFIRAADQNHIDWRLLPSIAVIESGGGKAFKNNNIFGWDNGDWFFPSVASGIREVAFRLGHSPLYRDLDVPGKLRVYNPDETYGPRVMSVMNRISPAPELAGLKERSTASLSE